MLENFLSLGVFTGAWYLGLCVQAKCEDQGYASWSTPKFLGNGGRSPIFPFKASPYFDDYEELIQDRR